MLYFVQDENTFINPLLQVGSGSVENSTESGSSSLLKIQGTLGRRFASVKPVFPFPSLYGIECTERIGFLYNFNFFDEDPVHFLSGVYILQYDQPPISKNPFFLS